MHINIIKISRHFSIVAACFLTSFLLVGNAQAAQTYTPSHVYSNVEYADKMLDGLLASKNISELKIPLSKEYSIKAMHVYELHVSVLTEFHRYSVSVGSTPPPLPVSTPIEYTPSDVYFLSELLSSNLEEIYFDQKGAPNFAQRSHSGKTPNHVFQKLFEVYYKLNRLNGKSKISPDEVFAQSLRAKEDLQYTLQTLSKRLKTGEEEKKRLLITAIYGMHSNGSVISEKEQGKTPTNVVEQAFSVRDKLNLLRERYKLPKVNHPEMNVFFGNVKPIDVFLQTQFIIAELNLLKMPMAVSSTTNSAKPVTDKTPSDVYQEMKHIEYMLDRLLAVL